MVHEACGFLIHGQGHSTLRTLAALNYQYGSLKLVRERMIGRVQHGVGEVLVMTVRAGKPVKYSAHDRVFLRL